MANQPVPAAGPAEEPGEQHPVNYSQYIDEAILTQMSVEEEDLPMGRSPFAAAGGAAGEGEGDGVFAGVEAEELLFAQQRGDGFEDEDEDEEDLLLALAMQLTPASIPPPSAVGTAPAAVASLYPAESNSQVLPLSFPGSNSQAETYRKAQTALEQFLAATQRECDDILECSAPQQHEQQIDDDKIDDDNIFKEGEPPEIHQHQPEKQHQGDIDFIPQVDGAFDDDSPAAAGAAGIDAGAPESEKVHNVTDNTEKMDIDNDNAIAVEEVKVVHGTGINQPLREAYVSRDRVRTSGQYLSASMRFLAAAENEKEEEEDDGGGVEDLDVQKQEVNGTIGDIVLSADLPPTQPIENLEEENFGEAEDVLEEMEEDDRGRNPAPVNIAGPSLGNNLLQNNGSNWWREEASQVPFEDLEWDLLDDDVGGEMPEDYVIDSMIYNKDDDDDTAREVNIEIDVDNEEYLQQGMEYQQEEGNEIQIVKYSYFHSAPTESHLLSSGWEQGVLPIVHQGAHYSNRGHVPARAPVFAGKEFRVPCTASAELPVFSNVMEKARVLFKQKENRGNSIRGVIAFTPVRKSPSRAETDSWLASYFVVGRGNSNSGGASGKRSGSGAGFIMDPNTGKLVSVEAGGKAAAGGGGSAETSQPLSGGGSAGDLLGTPSLASIPSSDPRKRLKSLHQKQQHQQQQRVYSTPEVELLGGVKSNSLGGGGGGDGGGKSIVEGEESGQKEVGNEEEQQEYMRPPSPKYDEASFFYNNPFISDAAPSFRGGGGSGASGARSRLSMQGRNNPIAAGTSPALGSNNPQGNFTGQQRAYGQQQQPMSTRKSALKPQQQAVLLEASQGSKDAAGVGAEERKSKKSVAFTPEEDHNVAPAVAAAAVPAAAPERAAAAAEEIPIKATKPKPKARSQFVSQITPPSLGGGKTATPSSQLGFKRVIAGKGQGLTLASIEVHADCRGQLLPDPRYDAVRAVVIAVTDDEEDVPDGNFFARIFLFDGEIAETTTAAAGAAAAPAIPPPAAAAAPAPAPAATTNIVNNLDDLTAFKLNSTIDGLTGCQIERFPTEAALFDAVIAAVRALDPDIVLGYEIQKESLGYLSDRAAVAFQRTSLLKELSRMPPGYGKATQKDEQKEQGTGGGDGGHDGRDGFGDVPGGGNKDQYD